MRRLRAIQVLKNANPTRTTWDTTRSIKRKVEEPLKLQATFGAHPAIRLNAPAESRRGPAGLDQAAQTLEAHVKKRKTRASRIGGCVGAGRHPPFLDLSRAKGELCDSSQDRDGA